MEFPNLAMRNSHTLMTPWLARSTMESAKEASTDLLPVARNAACRSIASAGAYGMLRLADRLTEKNYTESETMQISS